MILDKESFEITGFDSDDGSRLLLFSDWFGIKKLRNLFFDGCKKPFNWLSRSYLANDYIFVRGNISLVETKGSLFKWDEYLIIGFQAI